MSINQPDLPAQSFRIDRIGLDELLAALKNRGYTLVGPTVRDHAMVYDELTGTQDLPVGKGDQQEAGTYQLIDRGDAALFGYNLGPHSWKKYMFPPRHKLWQAELTDDGLAFSEPDQATPPKYAFIGVRACELHAIQVQDKVFAGGDHRDAHYCRTRERAFIVAVNCSQAAATCFCPSMNTGPAVTSGFDIALTEVIAADAHYFVMQAGSQLGQAVLDQITPCLADSTEIQAAAQCVANARAQMERQLDTADIQNLLYRNAENPRWEKIAQRCLSCANCTMVCPTCFCSSVEDTTDLTGSHAERWRQWDSCFTLDFSYLHGGSVRTSTRAQYRQWMTHKLASWIDQFDTSGCVGCGRCITWCPVGIDITEEVRLMRENDMASSDNSQRSDR